HHRHRRAVQRGARGHRRLRPAARRLEGRGRRAVPQLPEGRGPGHLPGPRALRDARRALRLAGSPGTEYDRHGMETAPPAKVTYVSLAADDPALNAELDAAIAAVRGRLGRVTPQLIGGRARAAAATFDSVSPADTRVVV